MFFRRAKTMQPAGRPLYGVNLGGWLMLERWITPALFGKFAPDEFSLYTTADKVTLAAIKAHMDSFITKEDFQWLKDHGIKAVRLPIGYGVFGDEPPYAGTLEYVDKAFSWAEDTGLKLLLDLHTAPGSQNGTQEGGRIGPVAWHKHEENIIRTLMVISRLARRYGKRKCLLGIELLNEPSRKIPRRKLVRYYTAAYGIIRQACGDNVWVVFSDGFKACRWKRVLRRPKYTNVYIDTHQYQTYMPRDKRLDLGGHVRKTLGPVRRSLAKMTKYHPVIVGEWSLVLDSRSLGVIPEDQKAWASWVYGGAQLMAYETAAAWFYWTYKTPEGGAWSFRDSLEKGRLPELPA